jgi:hypothetical protein
MAPYRPTATGFVWAPLRMSGRPQQHEPPPLVDVVVYYGARAAIPAPHDQAAYELGGAVLWRSAPLMEESTLPPPAAAGGEAVAVAASDIDPVRPGCGASNGKKVMIEENDLFCDVSSSSSSSSPSSSSSSSSSSSPAAPPSLLLRLPVTRGQQYQVIRNTTHKNPTKKHHPNLT